MSRSYRRRRNERDRVMGGLAVLLIPLLIIGVLAGSCAYSYTVSPDTAQHKVEDAGYNNVVIGDRHVFTSEWRCGKGYVVFFDFTAEAPNGRLVHGRICKGEPPFQGWRINY